MSRNAPDSLTIDGSPYRVAILAARYNQALVDSLVQQACHTLESSGVQSITTERAPGSAELPYAASVLAATGQFDAIIVIGVVIAGDTNHHNVIGDSTAIALHELSIKSSLPIINGILVVENMQQAKARAGSEINRGKEFAQAALEMIHFSKKWKTTQSQ